MSTQFFKPVDCMWIARLRATGQREVAAQAVREHQKFMRRARRDDRRYVSMTELEEAETRAALRTRLWKKFNDEE